MALLVPPRRPARERLDDPGLAAEETVRSLRDISLVNRRWGGSKAIARHLAARIRRESAAPVRLLDVGAGSGDVTRRLVRQLGREGFAATAVAADLQWRHLAAGRRLWSDPLDAAAADAFALPFPPGAFDWAISTLFFHHFSPEQNVRVLRELTRVARRGFVLLDLRRHLVPLAFVGVAGRIFFESRVSIEDGAASVRQAYTPSEAREIARRVAARASVERVFPYRMLISGPAP
jgi:ubiquinone/menaquinone biosynthesis C-methylase UbiE